MQKISKYGLRKNTVGLASIMIGTGFGISTVQAETVENSNEVVEKTGESKMATVKVNHFIEGTTTPIINAYVYEQPIGAEYNALSVNGKSVTVKEDVPGDDTKIKYVTTTYEVVNTPSNANGIVTEAGVEVTYYYRAVVTERIADKGAAKPRIVYSKTYGDVRHAFDPSEKYASGSLFGHPEYGDYTQKWASIYELSGQPGDGDIELSRERAEKEIANLMGYESAEEYNRSKKDPNTRLDFRDRPVFSVGTPYMTIQRPVTVGDTPLDAPMFDVKMWDVDSMYYHNNMAHLELFESNIPNGAELEFVRSTYRIENGSEKPLGSNGFDFSEQNGTMEKEKTTHFTHYYRFKKREVVQNEQDITGSVVVKYVDTDGNEIKPQVDVLKNVSAGKKVTKDIMTGTHKLDTVTDVSGTPTNYNVEDKKEQTIQKDGKTYVLTRVLPKGSKFNNTEATSGIVKEGTTTVVYEYREVQKGKLIVNHYKEGTTDKLSNGSTAEMNVGDKYTTSPSTITSKTETQDLPDKTVKRTISYELVKTPDNANGTIAAGDNVVNYYYREIVKEDVIMKRTKDVVEYHSESGYDVQHVFDSELEKDVIGFAGANSIFLNQKYGIKTQVKRTVYDATIGFDDKPGGYPSDDKIREAEERFVRMIGYTSLSQFNSSSDHKPLKLGEQAVYMHSHLGNTISPDLITGAGYYGTIGDTATFRTRSEDDLDVFESKDESMLNVYESMLPSGAELELTKLTYNIDGGEEKLAPTTGYTYSRDNGTMVKDKTTHFTYHYKLKKHEEKSEEAMKGSVVVKYVDTDGNEIKDAVQLVTDADAGKKVTTKLMSGTYEISSKTENVDGLTTYDAEPKKEQRIEINGKVYTLKRVLPKGTKFNNTEATSGVVTEGVTTVVYEYELVEKDGVIANYYKEGTTEKLADSVVQNELVIGTDYKTESKTIAPKVTVEELPDRTVKRTVTYTLVKEPENKTGKVIKGGTTVNYYYKEVVKEDITMKKDGVVANYYKEGTTEKLADSVVQNELVIGTDYKTESKTIAPKVTVEELPDRTVKRTVTYTLVKEPENKTGKVIKGGTTVNYYYKEVIKEDVTMKKDGVVANYYKEGTTEKLADSVVETDKVIGTDYKTESKTIAPKVTVEELPDRTVKRTVTYTLVKEPENKTGKVIKGGTTVNYYYKEVIKEDVTMKKDGVVANYYKEGTTEKLADSVVETDKVIGTDYATKAKVIEPKVSVEELEDKMIKRIVSYELVGTPKNATGKIVKGGVVVNYYYRERVKEEVTPKYSNVVINHYKYGTTEKIGDTETRPNVPIGSSYATEPKVIPPKVVMEEYPNRTVKRMITYVPVEPTNKNGKVIKGGVVVNYYYKEVVKEDITKKEEPVKPVEPTKPTEPKVPVKPGAVKPTEPKKPVEPAKLVTKEPVKPTEPGKFTLEKPVKPTEPVKPRKPVVDPNDGDFAETKKPIAPVKPVEPTKPTMEQPVEPVKPEMEKPTEPVKPAAEKPVEPVKPKEEPKVEEPKVKEEQPKVEPKEQPKKKLPETGDTTNLAVMGLGALIAARRLRRKEQ